MTLNPISFAHEVNRQFLRYQLTAFPLSDPDLAAQAREMMGGIGEASQLVKGPYVSLSRSYAEGALLSDLVDLDKLHPAVAGIAEHPRMFAHQEAVFNAAKEGHHCLVSTGTGSGKTEAFLYPILDHCFRLRDSQAPPGIVAIIVYPMNALAIDQLDRLRHLLAGTGITFGMYIGATPENEAKIANIERMKQGEGREKFAEYRKKLEHHPNVTITPFEERLTEEEIRTEPPRILLTNVNQLEYLMTRGKDIAIFENAPLRFIVFDEAHTYSGSRGAEVAVLIRRVRAFCNKTADQVLCIGTSATILDPKYGEEAGRRFANRFFGVDPGKVSLVKEIYETETWPAARLKPRPMGEEAPAIFRATLHALDGEGDAQKIYEILNRFSQVVIDDTVPWREGLYLSLKSNEIVKVIHDTLDHPMHLSEATRAIWQRLGRRPPSTDDEMELLTYLALGAAAEKDNYPLLRPQLHYFIRGLGGTAAILQEGDGQYTPVKIYFSKSHAAKKNPSVLPSGIFPVVSCKNCGQHFFEMWMGQLTEDDGLSGGFAEGDNIFWPRFPDGEGEKVTFTNRFVSEIDDDDGDISERLDRNRDRAYICQFCGTLHKRESDICLNPACKRSHSLSPVYVLNKHGTIETCPSCLYRGSRRGGTFFSPLRPMTAVAVADVHILAQEMINSQSIENRKIIVFADNRQEAAFQAAWMADHARRYRLRHLIYRLITNTKGPVSIGDLVEQLNETFKENKELARALAPEVYANLIEEIYSTKIERDMKRFLRITVIRELVTSFSQRDSLETWGKARVMYHGVFESDPKILELSHTYHISPKELVSGIESLLDMYRRSNFFYDRLEPIFTHYWHAGHEEVQRGFLPLITFPPKGLKLSRQDGDKKTYVIGITSSKGRTSTEDFVRKWGIEDDQVRNFITDLWKSLTDSWKILTPVTLQDQKGRPLPNASGVYQIDSAKIGIVPQHERYRCSVCNRIHTREAPMQACSKIHCPGRTVQESPPDDDYNVSLLSREFIMLMAREHTAQVPDYDRQYIEKEFKRENGSVNCLVATPTLELGIDIGSLDIVLLRNVPPLPANYWQRSGRAGRRHRMAVIYTYATKKAHDEYFYSNPMRLLGGTIYPPRLNLRNPVMIQKHIHATIVSELIRLSRNSIESGISPEEALVIQKVLEECLPSFVSGYLIEKDRIYRRTPPDLKTLNSLTSRYSTLLCNRIGQVFSDYWPEDSAIEVRKELLQEYLDSSIDDLSEQVRLIHQRLMWAILTRNKLSQKEQSVAALDEMEQRLLQRCRMYLEELLDPSLENYTLNVLARGGYLPGYAMNQGAVSGFASNAFTSTWRRMTFEINRPYTLALREYIPGNLIYANGGKYKVSWYHLTFEDDRATDPDQYLVDTSTFRIFEQQRSPDGYAEDQVLSLPAVPICDTELGFLSHVSDEEENRFRMPVTLSGVIRTEHRGIDRYVVKEREFSYHHGQKIRFVNIGSSDRVKNGYLGYPLCNVCGAVRSPYASDVEIQHFIEHHTRTCGRAPAWFGFSANAQVDGLYFENISSISDAINLAEGLRMSANISLEMEPDDLQILLFTENEETHHLFVYDPMPGGSGIIDQLLDDWVETLTRGISSLQNCSGACEEACYDCLKTYRNMLYHPQLNRFRAAELLDELRHDPNKIGSIPPKAGDSTPPEGQSTNTPEMRLSAVLQSYRFPNFDRQKEIPLPGSLQFTRPDFYYESPDGVVKIAIYLDGLSKNIHGNEERQRIDHLIRAVLGSQTVKVVEIAASDLDDPVILRYHLKTIAQKLNKKDIVRDLEDKS